MKSPLWLPRIRHGFILRGMDNNRLYSGNHVTIISKISPHTGDWWAGLQKMCFFPPTPNPASPTTPPRYLLHHYLFVSHFSLAQFHASQYPKRPKAPKCHVKAVVEPSALQLPGTCTDVWKSRVCPSVPPRGYQINQCCSHRGGFVESHPLLQPSLAADAMSAPAWRIHPG